MSSLAGTGELGSSSFLLRTGVCASTAESRTAAMGDGAGACVTAKSGALLNFGSGAAAAPGFVERGTMHREQVVAVAVLGASQQAHFHSDEDADAEGAVDVRVPNMPMLNDAAGAAAAGKGEVIEEEAVEAVDALPRPHRDAGEVVAADAARVVAAPKENGELNSESAGARAAPAATAAVDKVDVNAAAELAVAAVGVAPKEPNNTGGRLAGAAAVLEELAEEATLLDEGAAGTRNPVLGAGEDGIDTGAAVIETGTPDLTAVAVGAVSAARKLNGCNSEAEGAAAARGAAGVDDADGSAAAPRVRLARPDAGASSACSSVCSAFAERLCANGFHTTTELSTALDSSCRALSRAVLPRCHASRQPVSRSR